MAVQGLHCTEHTSPLQRIHNTAGKSNSIKRQIINTEGFYIQSARSASHRSYGSKLQSSQAMQLSRYHSYILVQS